MDPHTSLRRLCMDEHHRISLNDMIESKEGLDAYDGITDLEYKKNLISNEFAVKLRLQYEVKKNGEKVVNCELLVALKGELYFFDFVINPEQDDVELGVIFGHSFCEESRFTISGGQGSSKLTKAIVEFGNGILTIWPDLITFNSDSDDELDALIASINVEDLPPLDISDFLPFVCNMGKNLRNKKKPFETYKMSYDGEGPSLTINQPRTQKEVTREEIKEDLYERIMILNARRPIIETLKYSDKTKSYSIVSYLINSNWMESLNLNMRWLDCKYASFAVITDTLSENPEMRIRPDLSINMIIPNHLHVGTLDKEIGWNRDLNSSGTSTGRPLGAHNLGVATPRALVYAGLMTSKDARSWCVLIKVNGWFWRLKMCTFKDLGFKAEVRREVLDVVEALDIENSRASSFQMRGIHVVETKVNAVRDWCSPKTLPEVRNNKVENVFEEEDALEYAEPSDRKAKQVTYIVQRTLCSPKSLVVGSIRRIKVLDTTYWGVFEVGTTLDIFKNIIFILYFQYDVLVLWIRRIELYSLVVFGECRHGYVLSFLMDMVYWSLE
nr:hypothetical protein [Tanacetum cinerariifolium]